MTIPYAHTPRPDTGVSNAQLGMWLFLASDVMLMASLFSGYVLLRTSAATIPAFPVNWLRSLIEGALLLGIVFMIRPRSSGRTMWIVEAQALLCAALIGTDLMWTSVRARDHVLMASWFALVGAHLVHVTGGLIATLWVATRVDCADTERSATRLSMLRLYWIVVALTWVALLMAFWI